MGLFKFLTNMTSMLFSRKRLNRDWSTMDKSEGFYPNLQEFTDMIQRNFGDRFEIRTNVPLVNLGIYQQEARNIDICLMYAGRVELAILFTDHNRDTDRDFKNTKEACSQYNIRFLNFFSHFCNAENYVVERINKTLGL